MPLFQSRKINTFLLFGLFVLLLGFVSAQSSEDATRHQNSRDTNHNELIHIDGRISEITFDHKGAPITMTIWCYTSFSPQPEEFTKFLVDQTATWVREHPNWGSNFKVSLPPEARKQVYEIKSRNGDVVSGQASEFQNHGDSGPGNIKYYVTNISLDGISDSFAEVLYAAMNHNASIEFRLARNGDSLRYAGASLERGHLRTSPR